jgi:hypothetical protein
MAVSFLYPQQYFSKIDATAGAMLCEQDEALQHAASQPETVDAIVTFSAAAGGASGSAYTLRANHTEVPTTRMTFNEFDLLPDPQYRQYWLFANIQQALDRCGCGCAPLLLLGHR